MTGHYKTFLTLTLTLTFAQTKRMSIHSRLEERDRLRLMELVGLQSVDSSKSSVSSITRTRMNAQMVASPNLKGC